MANRHIKVSPDLIEFILRDGTTQAFETDLPSDLKLVGVLAYPSAGPAAVVTLIVSSAAWPELPLDAPLSDLEIAPVFKVRR